MTPIASEYTYSNGMWIATLNTRRIIDLNGDGKADIIGFGATVLMASYSRGRQTMS